MNRFCFAFKNKHAYLNVSSDIGESSFITSRLVFCLPENSWMQMDFLRIRNSGESFHKKKPSGEMTPMTMIQIDHIVNLSLMDKIRNSVMY